MTRDRQTGLLHGGYVPPDGFEAFPPAIHHASTVVFKNVAEMRSRDWRSKQGYTYGLHGTPTTFTLESRIAAHEGGDHCILAPSGLAAIALCNLALLRSGDDVLIPNNAYGPSRDMGRWLARDFGVSARFYDPMADDIAQLIRPETKLVWAEAPGSVTMEVPDLRAIAAATRAAGVPLALDNTWSAGLALCGFDVGADIVMSALTKYASGGSDVLMGALVTRDKTLADQLALGHMRIGMGVSADDAYLVMRGLTSMSVRFAQHDTAAREVAVWLKAQPEVRKVLHPMFADSPGHANWLRDFKGAAGLFSIILDDRFDEAAVDRFVDALELFAIGYSWGGAHSLVMPYQTGQGNIVRLNIGLEHPADLIADLTQALLRF
jgi:cystathionine beta-lyase